MGKRFKIVECDDSGAVLSTLAGGETVGEFEGSVPDSYGHELYSVRQHELARANRLAEKLDQIAVSDAQYASAVRALSLQNQAGLMNAVNHVFQSLMGAVQGVTQYSIAPYEVPEAMREQGVGAAMADILNKSKSGDVATEAIRGMIPSHLAQQLVGSWLAMGISLEAIAAAVQVYRAMQAAAAGSGAGTANP